MYLVIMFSIGIVLIIVGMIMTIHGNKQKMKDLEAALKWEQTAHNGTKENFLKTLTDRDNLRKVVTKTPDLIKLMTRLKSDNVRVSEDSILLGNSGNTVVGYTFEGLFAVLKTMGAEDGIEPVLKPTIEPRKVVRRSKLSVKRKP